MTLKNVQYPSSERNWRAGGAEHIIPAEHILFSFYIYLFLYCRYYTISFIYLLYNDFKKTCDISNKDII